MSARQFLLWGLLGAVGAIYLAVGYFAAISSSPPLIALLVGLAPLLATALAAAWHSRFRWAMLLACAAGLVLLGLNLERLRTHVALFYFVQHVGAMGLLGLSFGGTLWGAHHEALCSRIATLMIPEPLDADYLRYTWQVTLAWTLFFIGCGLLSVVLFVAGPIAWWSLFANVLTPIGVGAMFVIEYLVRLRVLPHQPPMSIVQTIRAYQKYRA